MAVGNVIISVVDVGQGQCTFVEIWNNSATPKLTNTLLFDCGSDHKSTETTENLEYIVATVSAMTKPAFDCVFFSHSDKDHISLIKTILEMFTSAKKPVIKEVWYGGAHANYTKGKKKPFNILDYLVDEDYCEEDDIKSPPSNDTDYSKKSKKFNFHMWQNAEATVTVYTIIANVLNDAPSKVGKKRTRTSAEELNRVSLVVGLYYANASFVICGDATNKTMAAANVVFSSPTTVFNNNKMTTLPHHGSRATGLAVPSSEEASIGAISVVDTFSTLLKSKTITVSANQKHSHPSLELINHFIPTVTTVLLRDPRLKEKNSHRVTAHIDIDLTAPSAVTIYEGNDYTFETTINTYSTRYYDGDDTFSYQLGTTVVKKSAGLVSPPVAINECASWKFINTAGGTTSIEGFPNLKSAKFTEAPLASTVLEHAGAIAEIFKKTRIVKPATQQPAKAVPHFKTRLKQYR